MWDLAIFPIHWKLGYGEGANYCLCSLLAKLAACCEPGLQADCSWERQGKASLSQPQHCCLPSLWDHVGASAPAWPGGDCCALLVMHCFGFWSLSPSLEIFQAETSRDTWRKSCSLGALGRGANWRAFFWNNHQLPFHFTPWSFGLQGLIAKRKALLTSNTAPCFPSIAPLLSANGKV